MQFPLYHWIGKAVEILIVGYGLWRGDRPVRIATVALLVGIIVTPLSQDHRFMPGPQWGLAIIDSAFFAVLLWLVIRHGRAWMMAAAAFELLSLVCHLVLIFDRSIQVWVYIALMNLLGYGVMFAIAFGAWQADRRRRLQATDPAEP